MPPELVVAWVIAIGIFLMGLGTLISAVKE